VWGEHSLRLRSGQALSAAFDAALAFVFCHPDRNRSEATAEWRDLLFFLLPAIQVEAIHVEERRFSAA
jgi:hypothetical protein